MKTLMTLLTLLTFVLPFVLCAVHGIFFHKIARTWLVVASVSLTFGLAVLTAGLLGMAVASVAGSALLFALIYTVMCCGLYWTGLRFYAKVQGKHPR